MSKLTRHIYSLIPYFTNVFLWEFEYFSVGNMYRSTGIDHDILKYNEYPNCDFLNCNMFLSLLSAIIVWIRAMSGI